MNGEWISVDERLPDNIGCYLVYVSAVGKIVVSEFGYFGTNEFWHTDVTHWMPLPEPPK